MTQGFPNRAVQEFIAAAPLPIIPVLDLKGGKVVRAIAGDRERYRPWYSPLCPSAEPLELIESIAPLVEHNRVYVADIDALEGGEPDWATLAHLAKRRSLICDIGVRNKKSAEQLANLLGAGGEGGTLVLASETICGFELIDQLLPCDEAYQLAFSFDFKGNTLLSAGGWLNRTNWLDAAARLAERGLMGFLLVDVHATGSGRGGSLGEECRQLRQYVANAEIVAGGGVGCSEDTAWLREAGCDAVLAASALHGVAPRPGR